MKVQVVQGELSASAQAADAAFGQAQRVLSEFYEHLIGLGGLFSLVHGVVSATRARGSLAVITLGLCMALLGLGACGTWFLLMLYKNIG